MSVEIKVPSLGESVTEATVARWMKKAGDAVAADEPIVELETDKVSLEVPSPVAGVIEEIIVEEGADVEVGALIGRIAEGAAPAAKSEAGAAAQAKESGPAASSSDADRPAASSAAGATGGDAGTGPAARKIADEKGVDLASVQGTGPKGNVTKG
ncbi:MAG: E3 binding domain-containing protein, partial [Geminicoccaceae bacterium]|nr:E3 binding domain-containing protein [Geminicoccaceae bacterium]